MTNIKDYNYELEDHCTETLPVYNDNSKHFENTYMHAKIAGRPVRSGSFLYNADIESEYNENFIFKYIKGENI